MKTPGQVRFIKALNMLEMEGVLDKSILISAASLRILGVRIHTYFIDLLTPNSYYQRKAEKLNFSQKYELEPILLKISDFSMRIGTVKEDLCSFRHLVKPYNVYEEAKLILDNKTILIKIRPQNYVRKDCEEAIERLIQGTNEKYWQELYDYHKQIEAIDLGIGRENLKLRAQKFLKLED